MLCSSNRIKKKGYALIFTLVLGTLMISIMLIYLKLYMNQYKYTLYFKQYAIKCSSFEEGREYLLTYLHEDIIGSLSCITEEAITQRYENNTAFKITYKDAYLLYSREDHSFVMYSPGDEYSHMETYFSCKVENGTVCFLKKKSLYKNGRI